MNDFCIISGSVNFEVVYDKLHSLMNDSANKVRDKVIRSLLLISN